MPKAFSREGRANDIFKSTITCCNHRIEDTILIWRELHSMPKRMSRKAFCRRLQIRLNILCTSDSIRLTKQRLSSFSFPSEYLTSRNPDHTRFPVRVAFLPIRQYAETDSQLQAKLIAGLGLAACSDARAAGDAAAVAEASKVVILGPSSGLLSSQGIIVRIKSLHRLLDSADSSRYTFMSDPSQTSK